MLEHILFSISKYINPPISNMDNFRRLNQFNKVKTILFNKIFFLNEIKMALPRNLTSKNHLEMSGAEHERSKYNVGFNDIFTEV